MFLNEVSSRFGLNEKMSLAETPIGRALNGLEDLFAVDSKYVKSMSEWKCIFNRCHQCNVPLRVRSFQQINTRTQGFNSSRHPKARVSPFLKDIHTEVGVRYNITILSIRMNRFSTYVSSISTIIESIMTTPFCFP